jgi:hypothetical protein
MSTTTTTITHPDGTSISTVTATAAAGGPTAKLKTYYTMTGAPNPQIVGLGLLSTPPPTEQTPVPAVVQKTNWAQRSGWNTGRPSSCGDGRGPEGDPPRGQRVQTLGIWNLGLLCDVPIGAHFNTSHDKAHCALSRVGAGLRRY